MIAVIAIILFAVMVLCIMALRMDAKQKRIKRQLATALSSHEETDQPTGSMIRRQRPSRFLKLLFNYEPDASYQWPVSYMILGGVVVAFAAFATSVAFVPWWLALVCGIIEACFVVRMYLGWQRRRYADRLLRQLPDAIEYVVTAVRAGLPIGEAFHALAKEMADPTREQFAAVVQEMALNRRPEEALAMVYDRTKVEEYAIFSVTLAVQSKSGGRLADTLQTLAETVRQRVALAGRAKALAAEAKLSARVLAVIPILAGLGLYAERPQSLDPLFYDPRGHFLLGLGSTTLVLGILTMRRMILKGTTV